ncbi:hypothetical protein HGRIS_003651 [Hohenbuehelia grisea]|uniref:Regulator of volume decrease after cellular swelling-domain-containing protein n=1 Tax=Hohenbuehelia grisea TaxID=104357 RepID=A0ABR3JG85_9AGAR
MTESVQAVTNNALLTLTSTTPVPSHKKKMPAATLIDSLPASISPEEHKVLVGSTPVSFSDIPPVLRHKEENVAIAFDPPVDGFTTENPAKGTLYVIESALVFMPSSGRGVQINYPSITLHAISRADSGPSVYCQLDDSNPDDKESCDVRELHILPQDSSSLEPIFEALSICAALHPDKFDSDDEMDDAFIAGDSPFEVFTGDGDEELSEVGRVRSDFVNDNRYAPY